MGCFPDGKRYVNTPSFVATLILACAAPALCLLISVTAVHFYKLDRKKMEEVQERISEAKDKSKKDTEAVI